jgi:hypothetical protein
MKKINTLKWTLFLYDLNRILNNCPNEKLCKIYTIILKEIKERNIKYKKTKKGKIKTWNK